MIYSVWDTNRGEYDYYEAPGTVDEAPPQKRLRAVRRSPIGITHADAAWILPPGSRKVGRGELAKGAIAVRGGSARALGDDAGEAAVVLPAMFVVIGVGLWIALSGGRS